MRTLFYFCVIVFLSSCSFFSNSILQVGDYRLSQKELEQRVSINRLYYPTYSGDIQKSSLEQMKQAFLKAEILKKYRMEVTTEILDQEAERIRASTQNPDMLQKIQKIFEDDKKAYYKIFVLPVLVERVIYFNLFLTNQEIQGVAKKNADDYLSTLLEGKAKWGEFPSGSKFKVVSYQLSPEDGLQISESKKSKGQAIIDQTKTPNEKIQLHLKKMSQEKTKSEYEFWYRGFIEPNKNLKQYPALLAQVIDYQSSFLIVRVMKQQNEKKGIRVFFEVIHFPKSDFSKWLEQESSLISVKS